MIKTDLEFLRKNSEPVSVEEAKPIISKLIEECNNSGGYGLSAVQIGIPKRVAVMLKRIQRGGKVEYYNLINPKILESSASQIINFEGCLSMPGIRVLTTRAKSILIRTDSLDNPDSHDSLTFQGLLSCIAQHEVDHMNGVLITDREYKKKLDRNVKVRIVDNLGSTEVIKFKNFFKYPSWMIQEILE